MRKQKSVWFLILGLLIALAGCGSDGNGRSPMDGMGGDTVDMTALNAAKAAAMAAYEAAKDALADVEANQSADQASYDKAAEQVEAAKTANDKAKAAETVADAQKYQKMAEDANTEAMKYADMVTAANDMMALNAAKAAAMTSYEAAKDALEAVEDDQSADQASYDKAAEQVEAAKTANDKAQAAETVADAQKYQKMAEDANTEAMKYADMVTVAANKAASAAARAMAGKIALAIADPDRDMMLGENNAADGQEANDDLDNPSRPGKTTATTDNFLVSAGGIGTPPVIRIGNAGDASTSDRLGMEDAGINNNVEFAEEAGTAVGGFARKVHTRTQTIAGNKVVDKVTVLDNIDAAKNLLYREFYDDGDNSRTNSAELNAGNFDRAAVVSINAAGVLTLDTGAEGDIDGNHALFSSTAFPSDDDQLYTYENDDPGTANTNEERRGGRTLDGMFNGVPGRFTCTGDPGACTAGTDSDGNLDALDGTWTFTPDSGDHFIAGGSHDNDYLAFGYWLQSTGEGDATTYNVGTFANGSMPFGGTTAVAAAVSALTGTATYTGSAIGMFVMKTDIDGDNKGPVATGSGEFTADTTLTARFGGDAISLRDQFTISGRVHDFVLTNSDNTTLANDWSLNLQRAPFATRSYSGTTGEVDPNTPLSAHANTFTGATSGMEKGTDGRWTGMYYGLSPDTNPDTDAIDYGATNYPGGVAGEFIGHFEDGHAIGAFGATKR